MDKWHEGTTWTAPVVASKTETIKVEDPAPGQANQLVGDAHKHRLDDAMLRATLVGVGEESIVKGRKKVGMWDRGPLGASCIKRGHSEIQKGRAK